MDMTTPAFAAAQHSQDTTVGLSLLQLNLLRLLYLLLFVGLGVVVWPNVFQHNDATAVSSGVRVSLLAGLGLTATLGVFQPSRMLPLLIFEVTWKAIYLTAFVLPLWLTNHMTAAVTEDTYAVLMVAIFPPLMPWRYIFSRYFRAPAPWLRRR
jgi:hypothetical protein